MAIVDLVMPKLGESIMEATVLKWHKEPGDTVQMDETVLEIATDKVDSEVPSTASGVFISLLTFFHCRYMRAQSNNGSQEPTINKAAPR